MNQKLILYPFGLFLFVFILDKIILIPAIRDLGCPEPTPMENILKSLSHDGKTGGEKNAVPEVVFLGSSRSDLFKHLHPGVIGPDPWTAPPVKARLLRYHYNTHAVVRASELFVQYALLTSILESGRRPGLVVLEISPAMFNGNSPFGMKTYLSKQIYETSLLIEILPVLNGENRNEVLYRLLFTGYGYRFRPERALSNLLRRNEETDGSDFALLLLRARPHIAPLPAGFLDFEIGKIPPEPYLKRFIGYTKSQSEKGILRDYRFDPAELGVLKLLLKKANKAGVPLVVWRPVIHPLLKAKVDQTSYPFHKSEIVKTIADENIPYFNAEEYPLHCRRFKDSSHYSGRCAPYLMNLILDTARKKYPSLP